MRKPHGKMPGMKKPGVPKQQVAGPQSPRSGLTAGTRNTEDRPLVAALVRWFRAAARDLPWRHVDPKLGRRDAYRSLVSEVMLQQTQVSRVLEKFGPFLERFPTAAALASAAEHDVLQAWTGLGYYRRARSLHAAAKRIVEEFGGEMPSDVERLLTLPGVGRYTAGAIASMVFGKPEPIVDGNVVRVLFRVHGKALAGDDAKGVAWAWERAKELVEIGPAAELNEGMMELGATVCTPANPKCVVCPLAEWCVARAKGIQDEIPRPKAAARVREQWHVCVRVVDEDGRLLMVRREGTTLWNGLWEVPTRELVKEPAEAVGEARKLAKELSRVHGVKVAVGEELARFEFKTSACLVRFVVFEGRGRGGGPGWMSLDEALGLPISSPMGRVLRLG